MNQLKCAILAAGDSTRLPNKLLLPIKNGGPLFTSAMSFAKRHVKNPDICFVFKPESLITAMYDSDTRYTDYGEPVYQHYARGVCEAIKLVHQEFYHPILDNPSMEYHDILFLLGDNIFSDHAQVFPQGGVTSLVGVVPVEHIDPEALPHLDGYNRQQGEWVRRGAQMDYVIAGGYLLRHEDMKLCSWEGDLIEYFNKINASMWELDTTGAWTDLGTPEAYRSYWTK